MNVVKYHCRPVIAAHVAVRCELFPLRFGERRSTYIYMAASQPIMSDGDSVEFDYLPLAVRVSIAEHFKTVFELSYHNRIAYMKTVSPWTVEVEA